MKPHLLFFPPPLPLGGNVILSVGYAHGSSSTQSGLNVNVSRDVLKNVPLSHFILYLLHFFGLLLGISDCLSFSSDFSVFLLILPSPSYFFLPLAFLPLFVSSASSLHCFHPLSLFSESTQYSLSTFVIYCPCLPSLFPSFSSSFPSLPFSLSLPFLPPPLSSLPVLPLSLSYVPVVELCLSGLPATCLSSVSFVAFSPLT